MMDGDQLRALQAATAEMEEELTWFRSRNRALRAALMQVSEQLAKAKAAVPFKDQGADP